MLRRTVLSSLVLLLVVGSSQAAWAQGFVKIDGTVDQELPSQGITLTGKDGKKYAVGFGPTSKVALTGEGSADFLTTGSYVQMTVDMDGKGTATADVAKVQITVQGKDTAPGIIPAGGPDSKPGQPGKYFVRGTVKSNKDGTLTVAAAGKQVVVKLSPTVTVPVTIANWQMAKSGDAISGEGTNMSQPGASLTLVRGDRIEIKAAMPITKTGKK